MSRSRVKKCTGGTQVVKTTFAVFGCSAFGFVQLFGNDVGWNDGTGGGETVVASGGVLVAECTPLAPAAAEQRFAEVATARHVDEEVNGVRDEREVREQVEYEER